MQKWGRNYILTVSGTNYPIPLAISLPFTIEFEITRNTLTSSNVCQIRLYNLSKTNRNLLRRNAASGYSYPYDSIVLRAGYSGYQGVQNASGVTLSNITNGFNLPVIFSGNISQAWSYREGVNYITQIECYDGGFAFSNGKTNMTFPAGTPYQLIIATLIGTMPNVTVGSVGKYPGVTTRATTFSGNTADILRELTGGGFFIDNGIGNALGDSEYTIGSGPPLIIDSSVGLLNTPVLEQTLVRFDMVFEPPLVVGRGITLTSATEANFNGFYKITAVKHRGMISQTVCGDAVTTGEFFFLKTPTPVVSLG